MRDPIRDLVATWRRRQERTAYLEDTHMYTHAYKWCADELESVMAVPSRDTEKDEEAVQHIVWLVQRYGYARREGVHQEKRSGEWIALVEAAVRGLLQDDVVREGETSE